MLFAWAQTQISSILAGIWNATTPLWTVVMGLLLVPGRAADPSRRGRARRSGSVGVVVVLRTVVAQRGRSIDRRVPPRDRACLAATACYGFAVTYTGKHLTGRPDHPQSCAVPRGPADGGERRARAGRRSRWAMPPPAVPMATWSWRCSALGVLGTGLAYVLLYRVVALAGATTASTVTYLIPLVSTTLGIVVLGESLTWNEPVGAVLVLPGAWLTRPRARIRPCSADSHLGGGLDRREVPRARDDDELAIRQRVCHRPRRQQRR